MLRNRGVMRAIPIPPPDPGTGDPFPREPVAQLVRRVPAYARLAWRLGRDPLLSRSRRTAVLGAAGYLISPIDLIPGMIPVLGQLDDLLILVIALRFALAGLSPEQRAAHLAAVGLQDDHLSDDLHTLGMTAAWLARTGTRTALQLGEQAAQAGAALVRRAAPVGLRGVRRAAPAGLRGARRAGGAVSARIRPASPRGTVASDAVVADSVVSDAVASDG
jgi:uncharacterized membrane protein YkvA (DUF1232 family)